MRTLKLLGDLVERFQVLLAGILAIIAALIAYSGAEDQAKLGLKGAQVQAKATVEAIQKQLAASRQETASRRAAYARFEIHNLRSYTSQLQDFIDRLSQTGEHAALVALIHDQGSTIFQPVIHSDWEQRALLSVAAQGELEKFSDSIEPAQRALIDLESE